MKVSVVIPTWNHYELLTQCLRSLEEQTRPADEIVVVDDGSTDDTTVQLAQDFSDVQCIHRAQNGGFARASNEGLRAAQGEWILLLNNDMTLEPDFLEQLLKATEGTARLLAPLILWQDEPKRIYSAGDRVGVNGRPEAIGFREMQDNFKLPETIFGVTGGAGLFHRDVFETIGYLDETFLAYFEDADLCMRARLVGFTTALVPEAVAYHKGSASITDRSWWRSAQCYRNHTLLLMKNMPWSLVFKHLGAIKREQWHQAGQCFSAARCEFGAVKALGITIKTFCSIAVAMLPAWAARGRIQRNRKITPDAFEALLHREEAR